MTYQAYLKDHMAQGGGLTAAFLLCELAFGILADIPGFYLGMVGVGTAACFFIASYLSYTRKREFFRRMQEAAADLDKAYLLPELLETPGFLEGRILFDAMKEMERSMAEQIQGYERNNKEYKEFIELWVHEIKLPIATGKLLVENNRQFYDDSMMEELDKIDSYAEQALFYARSNYVEKDYVLKKISLKQVAGEVLRKNRKQLFNQHISMEIHDLEEEVYSDSKWLAFILQQLLSNSIKYMGEGERRLEWYAKRYQNQVKLYLKDSGIGIPAKDLPRVFEKGFTGDNGRTGKKSTGMGLYLCKKLCEKMGHRIELASSEGKGCLVVIRFPKGSMTGDIFS